MRYKKTSLYFSHLDSSGKVRMVDVSSKKETVRFAKASAFVRLSRFTLSLFYPHTLSGMPCGQGVGVYSSRLKKGDPLATAKVAGILAAKKVAELIPLSHPIPIAHCDIWFDIGKTGMQITATVKTKAATGVEMEALTAVSVAALTVYDMVKSVERGVVIEKIQLDEKSGGRSGHYRRK